ncbi:MULTISPECIES: Hcp family type VI secretion system effector [Dickeya]|uniref:Type VI secretion system effector, Hcp1 family n=1 Tax=Dickeya zeae (strain Ech586) TaxID=590409 RepID=D2C169_DICZ5|nr:MULTISPECIES: Hcp family type VI secretion system effector [Dickeya]ACZ75030.1 type VI secretion system effector, Hcp1 family [Dickeya parazeae Ech586]MBP2836359.1 Hcp family type VI secretion system effector [Dickeya parazeae]UCZ77030.1 Hcp family type VI secretion system effector [Dickeya zeae]
MANLIYLTIEGKNQGLISSGCSTFESIGNKYQKAHGDEIFVLSFEHDMTRAMNINHMPVSFTKLIDKSSPLLGVAITENEELSLHFKFYRTSETGGVELYYSIKINKAFIVKLSVIYPHAINHADNQPEELISIKYSDIQWSHHIARTSGYSIWGESGF